MGVKVHLVHYLILFLIVAFGFLGFWYFSAEKNLRFLAISLSVMGYVIWGIGHHYVEKRLVRSVVLEYLLVGLIILAAVSLLNRF